MKTKKNKSGITLMELIIAVAIIAMMAVAVYVVRGPADKKGKIELTKSTIELLCGAIEQYHQFYNEFPDPNGNVWSPGYYPADCDSSDPNNAEKLSYRLSLCPDAQAVLNKIDSKMIKNTGNNDYLEYVDAWGNALRYTCFYDKVKKQWDNFPLITSAGPDKKFNTEDDITSRK